MRRSNDSIQISSKNKQGVDLKKLAKPSCLSRNCSNSLGQNKIIQTYRSFTPSINSLSFLVKPQITAPKFPREIFVIQNGSEFLTQPMHGFFHTIPHLNTSNFNHSTEMIKFFKACQHFFNSSTPAKYLFSYKGSQLTCLHETPDFSKIVLVSSVPTYLGVLSSMPSNPSFPVASLQSLTKKKKTSLLTERIKSQYIRRVSPIPEQLNTEKKTERPKRFEAKEKVLKSVKLNVSNVMKSIEKYYPALNDQKMKEMKKKFKMREAKIHKFSAKFKTLVFMSCTVDPMHRIEAGISKSAFIEYQACSDEQSFVLGRIFDAFDKDEGGTISWEEFFTTISVIENGENDEKIDLFFKVYDTDKNGKLCYREVRDLCKVQLDGQSSDLLIEDLAEYFAGMIFDAVGVEYDMEIDIGKIKELVGKGDKGMVEMFCRFKFLKL